MQNPDALRLVQVKQDVIVVLPAVLPVLLTLIHKLAVVREIGLDLPYLSDEPRAREIVAGIPVIRIDDFEEPVVNLDPVYTH